MALPSMYILQCNCYMRRVVWGGEVEKREEYVNAMQLVLECDVFHKE